MVKCRPPNNRDPLPDEISSCRPYLDEQVALIDPAVVLTLGNFATKTLLATAEGITKLRGRTYPYPGAPATVIVPTFHPAAALRGGGEVVARMRADFVRARQTLGPARATVPSELRRDCPDPAATQAVAGRPGRPLAAGRPDPP